jgi:NitT/TauT family transport system substrate-binding protein
MMSRFRIGAAVALLVLLAMRPAGAENATVKIGITNTSSDVGIFIAQEKGYFQSEGITIETVSFNSAAQMIAPLGIGELAVGSGSAAASLYNAVARGIAIKIVADAGSAPPGYGHNILLVRKALVTDGRYKGLADLKGMKVALTAAGASSTAMLDSVLATAGLRFADVEPVYLGYPDHIIALATGKVDAALTAEPSATQAEAAGSVVRITSEDQFDPYHVGAVILYSGDFITNHADTARRFMRAYVKAIRFYNGALAHGRLQGPNADEVIAILTRTTNIKNPQVYRDISPQGCDPNGIPNPASLKKDFDFYRSQGWINGQVTAEQAVDLSFAQAADKDLGPYAPGHKE